MQFRHFGGKYNVFGARYSESYVVGNIINPTVLLRVVVKGEGGPYIFQWVKKNNTRKREKFGKLRTTSTTKKAFWRRGDSLILKR